MAGARINELSASAIEGKDGFLRRAVGFGLSLLFIASPAAANDSFMSLNIGGSSASVLRPARGQLAGVPSAYFGMIDSESVSKNSALTTVITSIVGQTLKRRGVNLHGDSEYYGFSGLSGQRDSVLEAARATLDSEKPARLVFLGRLSHDARMRTLRLELEVVDTTTRENLVVSSSSVTYPQQSPVCYQADGRLANARCLDRYTAFVAHAAESKIAVELREKIRAKNFLESSGPGRW